MDKGDSISKTEVLERLQGIFDDIFQENVKVTADLSADQVEEWDSLLHVVLLSEVEKAFSIKFLVGEAQNATNVGEFVDIICRHVREQSAV
ncbi:MAG: acyl carrier protein [Deltaproteobacteria bacterium]|nr:acyl carrier protein [Deltaproteobacteria bacterium]